MSWLRTRVKDKVMQFESSQGLAGKGTIPQKSPGKSKATVKDKILLFEENRPQNCALARQINDKCYRGDVKISLNIEDDVSKSCRESGDRKTNTNTNTTKCNEPPQFPPPFPTYSKDEVDNRYSFITTTADRQIPAVPNNLLIPKGQSCAKELDETSKIVIEQQQTAEVISKPLWRGRSYLKQLSTEELLTNLRIIERLRDSYIEEIEEAAQSSSPQPYEQRSLVEKGHDIKIYREDEKSLQDEEFGLSELHENEDSYIVEAYNTAGSELVISQLEFDHQDFNGHETIALEHKNYVSTANINISSDDTAWEHQETEDNLRDSQYSEDSESSIYMSLRDCLSGASLMTDSSYYNNTYEGETKSTKSRNLKIQIDVALDDDDDEDEKVQAFIRDEYESKKLVPVEKKDYLIEEIISTEEKYISDLEKIVKHYMPYMKKINLPEHLQGKQGILFGNIIEIYAESKNFLAALKICGYDHEKIAETFLRFRTLFQLYPLYSKNKPKADKYLQEFKPYASGKQEELGERLDLGSYLLTPIQRLGKYILFLKGINEQLNKKYLCSPTVQAALDMVRELMSRANDYIAIDSIKNCPINLSKDGGSFVMREKFNILRPTKFESMVFFFEKIIVFAVESYKNKEIFAYVDSIKMTDLVIMPTEKEPLLIKLESYSKNKGDPNLKDRHTYVLEAKSPRMKQFWTENIEKRLWDQLNKWKEEVKAQYGEGETANAHPVQETSTVRPKVERAKTLPERPSSQRRRKKTKSSTFYIKLG